MTLDEFLRTLETLIDDQVQEDDPGEGNFGCQNCRACYSCRFCVGCDSCEDCTYCEESIDSTSCTQSKRCVTCEKVSYCEDCRDCKASRYLTLCVDCNDCLHCLGCVGLKGAEFYVLNQKRSRKEYFTLLRQVQDLLRARYEVGWRPPAIGLSSEVRDPLLAGRDVELSTAPWLDDLFAEPDPELEQDRYGDGDHHDHGGWTGERDLDAFAAELEVEPELALPPRGRASRPDEGSASKREQAPTQPLARAREPFEARQDPHQGPHHAEPRRPQRHDEFDSPRPGRAREHEAAQAHAWEDSHEATLARTRPQPAARAPELRPYESGSGRFAPRVEPRASESGARRMQAWLDDDLVDDGEGEYDDRDHEGRRAASPHDEDVPESGQREPSSPWLEDDGKGQDSKRGSLRRAGRPTRKPDAGANPEPGTGTYRTGKAPARGESLRGEPRDEGTRTGLRTGRRPKREG